MVFSCAGIIAERDKKEITMRENLAYYLYGNCNSFPFLDAYLENENMVVEIALAGFKKDEFSVEIANNLLTLKGEKKKDEKRDYLLKGIKTGKFEVSYKIDSIYKTDPVASFEDGILKLVFEVAEDKKPKLINVK